MLARQDQYINEAALKLHHLVEDKRFCDQLWEREDYIRREKDRDDYFQGKIDLLEQSNLAKDAVISDMHVALADKDAVIADKEAVIADKDAEIESLKALLALK